MKILLKVFSGLNWIFRHQANLLVYDGKDTSATLLRSVTGSYDYPYDNGTVLPPRISSTGNDIFIQLTTDYDSIPFDIQFGKSIVPAAYTPENLMKFYLIFWLKQNLIVINSFYTFQIPDAVQLHVLLGKCVSRGYADVEMGRPWVEKTVHLVQKS